MRNKIAVILFIAGVSIALLPLFRDNIEVEKANELVEVWEDEILPEEEIPKEYEDVEGLLEIPIIDLKLPILHEAVHDNMRYSVATMTHKRVEEGKNFTIAGHRNLRKGKNFNRLNEVSIGDQVIVHESDNKHCFRVVDKFIVNPDEVEILEDSGRTEITLITCYPIAVATQRLVIRGVID